MSVSKDFIEIYGILTMVGNDCMFYGVNLHAWIQSLTVCVT